MLPALTGQALAHWLFTSLFIYAQHLRAHLSFLPLLLGDSWTERLPWRHDVSVVRPSLWLSRYLEL